VFTSTIKDVAIENICRLQDPRSVLSSTEHAIGTNVAPIWNAHLTTWPEADTELLSRRVCATGTTPSSSNAPRMRRRCCSASKKWNCLPLRQLCNTPSRSLTSDQDAVKVARVLAVILGFPPNRAIRICRPVPSPWLCPIAPVLAQVTGSRRIRGTGPTPTWPLRSRQRLSLDDLDA
jgi:hypothetical protein